MSKNKFSRRTFGKLAASSTMLWGVPTSSLFAATQKDPFILYIHCGSWDGMSAGLIQPRDVGDWQKGIFRKNSLEQSVNPNLNQHFKTGNLVVTDYHKPLASIAQHVCVATATPQSLAHEQARNIQHTGEASGTTQPAWTVGLAHALGTGTTQNIIVSDSAAGAIKGQSTSPELTTSKNLTEFSASVSDPASIPSITNQNVRAQKFWDALRKRHDDTMRRNPEVSKAVSFHLDTMTKGFPAMSDTALLAEITSQISVAKYEAELAGVADVAEVKRVPSDVDKNAFLEQLRLAAFLIKSGLGRGMTITTRNGDRHAGGSSVDTARSGSMVMAQVATFWKYIVSIGMKDRVMIVMSHEFSRTPYNNTPGPTATVKTRDPVTKALVDVSVRSPGLDHHLAIGMIFINGKVPPASRVGGISDLYLPFGSQTLQGIADKEIPAYKSSQLVGSMMMRCFDDIFPDERSVRQIWRNFTPIKLITG